MASVQTRKIIRVRQDVGSTGHSSVTVTSPQVAASRLDRCEGRGTGCVKTNRRPGESEEVTMLFSICQKGRVGEAHT